MINPPAIIVSGVLPKSKTFANGITINNNNNLINNSSTLNATKATLMKMI